VFEGTWGSSRANGFIGFDDITFFSAACSSKFILTNVLLISVLCDDITWIVITANTSVILQSIQSIKKCTTKFRQYMMHLCHSFVFLTNFWNQKCSAVYMGYMILLPSNNIEG